MILPNSSHCSPAGRLISRSLQKSIPAYGKSSMTKFDGPANENMKKEIEQSQHPQYHDEPSVRPNKPS